MNLLTLSISFVFSLFSHIVFDEEERKLAASLIELKRELQNVSAIDFILNEKPVWGTHTGEDNLSKM